MSESNRVCEIYVDDVLVTDVFALPENKVYAYQVAYGIVTALTRDYKAPRYVGVHIPGKLHPDLMVDYRYRFYTRIGYIIAETYISGEIIENRTAIDSTSESLAANFRREFERIDKGYRSPNHPAP